MQMGDVEQMHGADGVYNLSTSNVDAITSHFDRFASTRPKSEVETSLGVLRAYETFLRDRIPPAELQYPLDDDKRWGFEAIIKVSLARRGDHPFVASARAHLKRDQQAINAINAVKRQRAESDGM